MGLLAVMQGLRWIDVSSHQRPELMRWAAWGFPCGQYRLTLGRRVDPSGPLHRALMRSAGMLTGPYAVPTEYADPADSAWAFVDNIPDDDENDDWCDAERPLLTESQLRAFCDSYDRRSPRQRLAIYTGYPWWVTHVPPHARARYARYKLILAAYPYDTPAGQPVPMDAGAIARRSTPPPESRYPAIPPPWDVADGWQHTGQGSLPGYSGFLDMGVYRAAPLPERDETAALIAGHARAMLGVTQ
jgi:GH25 family lysozyme M1 (1,4-beta-N-acetylmuramidase)